MPPKMRPQLQGGFVDYKFQTLFDFTGKSFTVWCSLWIFLCAFSSPALSGRSFKAHLGSTPLSRHVSFEPNYVLQVWEPLLHWRWDLTSTVGILLSNAFLGSWYMPQLIQLLHTINSSSWLVNCVPVDGPNLSGLEGVAKLTRPK